MAILTCTAATNDFGKGPSPGSLVEGTATSFTVDFADRSVTSFGSFNYAVDDTPVGPIDTGIAAIGHDNSVLWKWQTAGPTHQGAEVHDMLIAGAWRDFFEYILNGGDDIFGSAFADKLEGYAGKDFILGNAGNDKLKGGPGGDTIEGGLGNDLLKGGPGSDDFEFSGTIGHDTVTDFAWKRESIVIDSSAAPPKTFGLGKYTHAYKDGVIIDFGKNDIKIEGLTMAQFHKADGIYILDIG